MPLKQGISGFIIIPDGKGGVMARRNLNPASRFSYKRYDLIGGGCKTGETIAECIAREADEEGGVFIRFVTTQIWVACVKLLNAGGAIMEENYKVFTIGRITGVSRYVPEKGKHYDNLGFHPMNELCRRKNKQAPPAWQRHALKWANNMGLNSLASEKDTVTLSLAQDDIFNRPSCINRCYEMGIEEWCGGKAA